MRILVAVSAYPNLEGDKSLYYVHSRNLYYKKNKDIDIIVLNFKTKQNYRIDGIEVISLNYYKRFNNKFDILILHAANIRNHYIFLKRYGSNFKKKIFFFHGHEILRTKRYYPEPYFYVKKNKIYTYLHRCYDNIKVNLWKGYFINNIKKVKLIFVSKWIYEKFIYELKLEKIRDEIKNNSKIISNSIGEYFENNIYSPHNVKYDFITIRSNIDESTYCVDLLSEIAIKYPQYKFCLIGKGCYFHYFQKPSNLIFIEGVFNHEILGVFLNQSKYALFLTRQDTQGLMACEVASYGIPLITSDIEICREIFSDCPNVEFLSNKKLNLNETLKILNKKITFYEKTNKYIWQRYYAKNTIYKEIEYIINYFENNTIKNDE